MAICLSFSSTSCTSIDGIADANIKSLIAAIESGEPSEVRGLFADSILREYGVEIDEDIPDLFSYYSGEFQRITSRPWAYGHVEDGSTYIDLSNYAVVTDNASYYFNILWVINDVNGVGAAGIWNLCLERFEDGQDPTQIIGTEWYNGTSYRGITLR